jgi:hypothetical protein
MCPAPGAAPPTPCPPRPAPPQIVEAVAPMRDQLDACVIFPSMPAVMKLNKLGTFSMSQLGQSKSIIGGCAQHPCSRVARR